MDKWYLRNTEFLMENEMPKLLWDFEIQAQHLISAKQPDLVIVKKENQTTRGLCRPGRPQSKN